MPRSSPLPILVLAVALAFAGCVKEEPVDAATQEEEPATDPTPPTTVAPTRPTPTPATPPPSSPPPTTPPPPPEEEAAPAPATTPRVDVFAWNGTLTGAGAAAPNPAGSGPSVCCASVAPTGENADGEFDVPEGLDGIVVELVWTDAQFDLDLAITASDFDVTPAPPETHTGHRWLAADGAPGSPGGRATIVITDADALALVGAWAYEVSPKGPANEVAFQLYVSLFHDEAPAGDYTAVPSGNP